MEKILNKVFLLYMARAYIQKGPFIKERVLFVWIQRSKTNEIRHNAVRGNETVVWRIPGVVHDMTEGENEGDITLAKCRYLLLNGSTELETPTE